MNEWTKTGIFSALAVVVVATAILSKPRIADVVLNEMEGKNLFADKFTDVDDAAQLEIVTFDEKLGKLRAFSVAKDKETGQWSIEPSHYPANNQAQLSDVLTSLIGLKVVGVHSEVLQDQEECQVVEPDIDEITTSTAGVGTLVTVRSSDNSELANLIIGSETPRGTDLRYVRIPGNNVIYVVRINTQSLTTDFKDWINSDLLDLASLDIRKVHFKDYSIIPSPRGLLQMEKASDINLSWDSEESEWTLDSMIQYKENQPTETMLLDDEEINNQGLNDLKFALDNLEIDSVEPKPEGLGADLAVEANLANNPEGMQSLSLRGFFPAQVEEGGPLELLSANGEMHVSLHSGVQYVIRFGDIVVDISADADDTQRYMVVTARLDESMLVPPTLEPEPEPEPASEPGSDPASETETEPEPEPEPEPAPPADPADGDKGDTADGACQDTDEGAAVAPEPAEGDTASTEEELRLKEFEREMNEFQDNRNDAIKQVLILNEKFADWFYLISEETYNKLNLGISDVIKEKEESDGGLDQFRDLENEGLDLPPLPGIEGLDDPEEPAKDNPEPAKDDPEPAKDDPEPAKDDPEPAK